MSAFFLSRSETIRGGRKFHAHTDSDELERNVQHGVPRGCPLVASEQRGIGVPHGQCDERVVYGPAGDSVLGEHLRKSGRRVITE